MAQRMWVGNPGCATDVCCGPCCVIARVEVRDCERQYLVDGADVTIRVKAEDHAGAVIGNDRTDDTGTVALELTKMSGIQYEVAVTAEPPDGATTEGETQTTYKSFTSHCGVNTIEVDFGAAYELCIEVVDSVTLTPLSSIPVELWIPNLERTSLRRLETVTSNEDGMACFSIENGGIYEVHTNVGEDANPDYRQSTQEIRVPSCEPYEVTSPIALITNHPGCYLVVVMGCNCGLPGSTVKLRGRVKRNTGVFGIANGMNPWEPWELTLTTDSTGRAWFCPTEEVPFFGNSFTQQYYDSDTNQWDTYQIINSRAEGPFPYPASGPASVTEHQFNPSYHHMTTPDGYFCNGNDECVSLMPATVAATVTMPGTIYDGQSYTLTLRGEHSSEAVYWYCESGFTLEFRANRFGYCQPFDEDSGRFTFSRLFIPCDDTGPFDFQVSEVIWEARGISGSSACPINWHGREWSRGWGGEVAGWISTYGDNYVDVVG